MKIGIFLSLILISGSMTASQKNSTADIMQALREEDQRQEDKIEVVRLDEAMVDACRLEKVCKPLVIPAVIVAKKTEVAVAIIEKEKPTSCCSIQ